MAFRAAIVGALLTTFVRSTPILSTRQSCSSFPYIISARGSEEDPGEGVVGTVAQMIQDTIPSAQRVAVDYPASVADPAYDDSVTDGINAMISLIQNYGDACGDESNIILLGFSQGGNVVTDVLAGGVDKPDPIGLPYTSYIKGVAVFGDPSFTAGQSFDSGNSTSDGIFARSEGGSSLALLDTFASVLQSYCDETDPYCASGSDEEMHHEEVPDHASAATTFLLSLQGY